MKNFLIYSMTLSRRRRGLEWDVNFIFFLCYLSLVSLEVHRLVARRFPIALQFALKRISIKIQQKIFIFKLLLFYSPLEKTVHLAARRDDVAELWAVHLLWTMKLLARAFLQPDRTLCEAHFLAQLCLLDVQRCVEVGRLQWERMRWMKIRDFPT